MTHHVQGFSLLFKQLLSSVNSCLSAFITVAYTGTGSLSEAKFSTIHFLPGGRTDIHKECIKSNTKVQGFRSEVTHIQVWPFAEVIQ
jgi:hypothetical protein